MLAAATFTLAGCGREENGITEPMPQGKTAQLELRLTGSGVSTKATGSALPTQNEENEGVSKCTPSVFYAQSPDFHKLGLCYYLKILYL